jgi:ABC-type antimicrobial peptide transport system permease subunit
MSDANVSQIIGRTEAPSRAAGAEVRATARPQRFLGWLIFLVLTVGLISMLSFSLSWPELMRSRYPEMAAWWEAHQFHFMVGGATAFGLLAGISIAGSLLATPDQRSRAGLVAIVFAVIAFAPLIHVCAAVARLGWNGHSASFASRIISHKGYEAGRQIDKLMITGIYFLKTAGFALLAGLGLMAIACVAAVTLESTDRDTKKTER